VCGVSRQVGGKVLQGENHRVSFSALIVGLAWLLLGTVAQCWRVFWSWVDTRTHGI